jgi:predicted TPR repeat methyltransferase
MQDTIRGYLNHAIACHQQGRRAEAREYYQRVLDALPEHADALHLYGISLFQDGMADEAEAYLRAAIALDSGNKDYYSNLGLVLKSIGRYDGAIRALHQSLAIDDTNSDCLNNLASTLVSAGRAEEAEDILRRLLEQDPNHIEACNNLAVILGSQSCEREVGDLYEHALRIQPDYLDARMNYGRFLLRCERYDEAEIQFRAALQLDTENLAMHRELADALVRTGRLDEARAVCDKALALAPDDADCHVSMGSVLLNQGLREEAEAAYRQALSIDPENARANNNMGALLIEDGNPEGALWYISAAMKSDPDFAEAMFNKGTALYKLGRLGQAAGCFSMAIDRNPRMPNAYRYLSEIYRISEMQEAQSEVLRLWLDMYPESATARHLLQAAAEEDVPERASDAFIREEFDDFADSFDATLAGLDYSTPEVIGTLLAASIRVEPGAMVVLDAGCGTGLCAPHLKPCSSRLIGVDLSEKMIARARLRNEYDELVVAELTEYLESARAQFDLIVSADTLVYFGALGRVLGAAQTALRAGGKLVFSVEQLVDETATGFRLNPSGRYAHSEGYLRRQLADCGFETVDLDYVTLRTEAQKPVAGLIVVATPQAVEDGEPS